MNTQIKNLRKVKALLIENDIKLIDVAREARVNRVTVSIVLTGKGKSRRVQGVIAKMVHRPYEALWGEPEFKKAA